MPIYGNPKPKILSDGVSRSGVRSLKCSNIWVPSKAGLTPKQRDQERPTPPNFGGFFVAIDFNDILKDGYYETQWNIEGGSGLSRAESTCQNFDPRYEERSLVLHPNWWSIQKKYWGSVDDAGRILWPQYLPNVADTSKSGLKIDSGNGINANPMYGRQTYLALVGGIYSFKYSQQTKPGSLYADIERIFTTGQLPGKPPAYTGRNWLKAPPKEGLRGGLWDLEEIFWLSDYGGWPTQTYLPAGTNTWP